MVAILSSRCVPFMPRLWMQVPSPSAVQARYTASCCMPLSMWSNLV